MYGLISNSLFCSFDNRYSVAIGKTQIQKILSLCCAINRSETGGILIGHYSSKHDCAHIKTIVGPAQDSIHKRTSFLRGVSGLQTKIDLFWNRYRHYYLGEWHFHPFASSKASAQDIQQMTSIALSSDYNCPEPILLIVGGDPSASFTISAYAFPKGQLVELKACK